MIKNIISYALSIAVIAFAGFALSFWILGFDRSQSISIGVCGALGGLLGPGLSRYLERVFSKKRAEH